MLFIFKKTKNLLNQTKKKTKNLNKSHQFKFSLIVCFVTISIIYIEIYQQERINFPFKTSLKFTQFKTPNCSPINISNEFKWNFLIDGVRYPRSVPLHKNSSINFECLRKNSQKIKIILAWNEFFGDPTYLNPFKGTSCPVENCILTNDRKYLNKSDLVIIHMRDKIGEVPRDQRPDFQRWVFVLYEPPPLSGDYSIYNNFFNLTSTYMIDSNFSFFYESLSPIQWRPNSGFNESFDFHESKSKFAAAVISNCGATSRRLDYIKQMGKYVDVDVFGKCGRKCPGGECKEEIGRKYKFYLAFENSFCKDYISEKFFNMFVYSIIPVVMGGGNYEYYVCLVF